MMYVQGVRLGHHVGQCCRGALLTLEAGGRFELGLVCQTSRAHLGLLSFARVVVVY